MDTGLSGNFIVGGIDMWFRLRFDELGIMVAVFGLSLKLEFVWFMKDSP